jgi:DNA repair protein RecO (recombination protein O)
MPHLSSPAIVLRIIEHGDHDKIVTAFTAACGKLSWMAKGAKTSAKRFAGLLEPFSMLDLVWSTPRAKGMSILQEASAIHLFDKIRTSYQRTVYASYWCELVYRWMDEGQEQPAVYQLLAFALEQLHEGQIPQEILHIAFQLHFLTLSGFKPGMEQCAKCRVSIDRAPATVCFDVALGAMVCRGCDTSKTGSLHLSKGTVQRLRWIMNTPLTKLHRIKFSDAAIQESYAFLEVFVPYHLGKETKSLRLLKQIPVRLSH